MLQAQTLELLLAGNDMVGRARTGCGKTLAFVLPIVEKLAGTLDTSGRRAFGRQASVIVLLPTRELAKQVLMASHCLKVWSETAGQSMTCDVIDCTSQRISQKLSIPDRKANQGPRKH